MIIFVPYFNIMLNVIGSKNISICSTGMYMCIYILQYCFLKATIKIINIKPANIYVPTWLITYQLHYKYTRTKIQHRHGLHIITYILSYYCTSAITIICLSRQSAATVHRYNILYVQRARLTYRVILFFSWRCSSMLLLLLLYEFKQISICVHDGFDNI